MHTNILHCTALCWWWTNKVTNAKVLFQHLSKGHTFWLISACCVGDEAMQFHQKDLGIFVLLEIVFLFHREKVNANLQPKIPTTCLSKWQILLWKDSNRLPIRNQGISVYVLLWCILLFWLYNFCWHTEPSFRFSKTPIESHFILQNHTYWVAFYYYWVFHW